MNGQPLGYVNDLAVAKDGTIYFTSSSTKWSLAKENNIIFEADRTGRSVCTDWALDSGVVSIHTHTHTRTRTHALTHARTHTHTHTHKQCCCFCLFFKQTNK